MPAKNLQRIDEENLFLHIQNKGVEGRALFTDREDYQVFLNFLEEYLTAPKDRETTKKTFQIYGRTYQGTPHLPKNYFKAVELIAYSLMPDHFHLLLRQVTKGSVENFLRSLSTRYSIYFNKKYNRSGSLFAGPYKSVSIKNDDLAKLTRFFHHSEGHSSYSQYLGQRNTPYVKPDVVLSVFSQGKDSYKDFVQAYKFEKMLEKIILENEDDHLGRRMPASEKVESEGLERREDTSNQQSLPEKDGVTPQVDLKPRPLRRVNEFIAVSTITFALLLALGIRNIWIAEFNSVKPLPNITSEVLSVTKEVSTAPAPASASASASASAEILPETPPEATPEATPKTSIKIFSDDGSTTINIRQSPTTKSAKIGQANEGDTFEMISRDPEWFEVKIASGSGFISARYVKEEN